MSPIFKHFCLGYQPGTCNNPDHYNVTLIELSSDETTINASGIIVDGYIKIIQ